MEIVAVELLLLEGLLNQYLHKFVIERGKNDVLNARLTSRAVSRGSISRVIMNPIISRQTPFVPALAAMCFAVASLVAAPAIAQTVQPKATQSKAAPAKASNNTAVQAQYRAHVARCNNTPPGSDRAACMKSAGAAREESLRGKSDGAQGDFEKNALLRCDAQPAKDRADCVARVRGQGTSSGSVQGGGIIRETVTTVPAGSGR